MLHTSMSRFFLRPLYILPSTCSITSRHLTLPASRTFESTYVLKPPSFYPFSLEQRNVTGFESKLNITWESMKQLNLIPEVIHDSTVDYVYPLVVTMSFVAISAIAIGLIVWREHNANNKRFDDVIETLNTGSDELDEKLARVTFRMDDTMEPITLLK